MKSDLFVTILYTKLLTWSFNLPRDFIEKNDDLTVVVKGTGMFYPFPNYKF